MYRVILNKVNGDGEISTREDTIDLDRVAQSEFTPHDESKGRKRSQLMLHYNADDFVVLYGPEAVAVQEALEEHSGRLTLNLSQK